jgi:hypothetical protein
MADANRANHNTAVNRDTSHMVSEVHLLRLPNSFVFLFTAWKRPEM